MCAFRRYNNGYRQLTVTDFLRVKRIINVRYVGTILTCSLKQRFGEIFSYSSVNLLHDNDLVHTA